MAIPLRAVAESAARLGGDRGKHDFCARHCVRRLGQGPWSLSCAAASPLDLSLPVDNILSPHMASCGSLPALANTSIFN